jgi:hypothetical protein
MVRREGFKLAKAAKRQGRQKAVSDPLNPKGLPLAELDGLEKFAVDRFEDGHLDRRYGLDPGIRHFVLVLRSQGVDTCQSCQGGPGHCYLEPTIEFRGGTGDGPRAVGVALTYGLPIAELRREWSVRDGEINGPIWTMTFKLRADLWLQQDKARTAASFKRLKAGRDAR